MGYGYNYFTRKRIDNLNLLFTGTYDYYKRNNGILKSTDSHPSVTGSLDGLRRYYLLENKFFMEGIANLRYSYSNIKRTTSDTEVERKDISNFFHVSAGLGVGAGRMEKVSDLWQAYYILDKLNQQNSLSRQLEEKDIFEFATLVSRLKNRRLLDFRAMRIIELTELDSLLHQQGLIKESDIAYFTTLNDYWSYGNFRNRESGIELEIWEAPDYSFSSTQYNNEDVRESEKTSVISNVSFKWTKQLNLKWERSFKALASYENMIDTIGSWYVNADNQIKAYADFNYGYYPNSRTALYPGIGYMGQNIIIVNTQGIEVNEWSHKVNCSISGNYYFSPHLQIAGSYKIYYSPKDYVIYDKIETNFNLAVRYAIF